MGSATGGGASGTPNVTWVPLRLAIVHRAMNVARSPVGRIVNPHARSIVGDPTTGVGSL
jgi:hypothetical protein